MKMLRRMLALLLALTLCLGLLPGGIQAKKPEARVMTAGDYETADRIFALIQTLDETPLPQTAGVTKAAQVYALVSNAAGVVPGSVRYQGSDRVVWQTQEGVACVWSAYLEELSRNAQPVETDLPDEVTIDYGTRGVNHGVDTYLVQPYYGLDSSFTAQYQTEAKRVAQVTGGTYNYKKTTAATIDFVATAIQNGGVVFFDSHGDTDYANGDDHTTGAHSSYLCLQTGTGLTDADYAYDPVADTWHAFYGGAGYSMRYYEVDGTAIANHMTRTANNGLLWAAICLGMATDGLHKPLMNKGLGAAYGYSQSVTFVGDYFFEEAFFDQLCTGSTVAQSISAMKNKWGSWDWSPEIAEGYGNGYTRWDGYQTAEEARADFGAFPIVVSKEDPYPGHGNVDDVQTVYATWKLIEPTCSHQYETVGAKEPTCTEPGYTGDQVCTLCGDTVPGRTLNALDHDWVLVNEKAPTCTQEGYSGDQVCSRCDALLVKGRTLPTAPHSLQTTGYKPVTCTEDGYTGDLACTVCGTVITQGAVIPASGHNWIPGDVILMPTETFPGEQAAVCSTCGAESILPLAPLPCPSAGYPDVKPGAWYHAAVDFVISQGIMKGTGSGFEPNKSMTRAELATIFWNLAGKPTPTADNPFSDVKETYWGRDAIVWAAQTGVVTGSGGKFMPNDLITREQVAVMFFRYTDAQPGDPAVLDLFPDASTASGYAREALSWAVELGLLKGSGGKLNPKGKLTRAEAAQILMNYYE